jgi:hypothetical protein
MWQNCFIKNGEIMEKMKLIHYASEKFSLEPREYDQSKLTWQIKPNGLWFSVQGLYDWKWWCEEENYELEKLVVSYELKLKEHVNILYIQTEDEIFNFAKQYPYLRERWNEPIGRDLCQGYELDWNKVKSRYQGMIISPYQWNCRLSPKSNWYYAWDCASGCIWDLDCIEEFKLMETHEPN